VADDADQGGDDSLLGNPERFEPSIGPDAPTVEVPGVGDGEGDDGALGADVDPAVSRAFWRLVVVFDVALLALAVGPMFIYFEGNWELGGQLLAVGALAFLYGLYRVRQFRADRGDDEALGGD
jgi:hypothetical protein